MLARRPGLAKVLQDHPEAADLFKLCESECFPDFMTDEQIAERLVRLEDMEQTARNAGIPFDRAAVKKLLHEQETVEDVDKALTAMEARLQFRLEGGAPAGYEERGIEEPEELRLTVETRAERIDRLTQGIGESDRPTAEALLEARQALQNGAATESDYEVLLKEAVNDARSFNRINRIAVGNPENVPNWYAMRGCCGPGRDCSAASLAAMAAKSSGTVTIYRYQAGRVFGFGGHAFSVVKFPDGTLYLVDSTFAQFLRAPGEEAFLHPTLNRLVGGGSNIRDFVLSEPAAAEMAQSLLQEGFVPLDEATAAAYAKSMAATSRKAEPFDANSLAQKILNGTDAELTETAGIGQPGAAYDIQTQAQMEGRKQLLELAEEFRDELKKTKGREDLVQSVEWVINRLESGAYTP